MSGCLTRCAGRAVWYASANSRGDVGAAACDTGPMQRTGEKIDRATAQDKVIGTGPLEQARRNLDEAVKRFTE